MNSTTFEVGATYETRSLCDHDCIFRITIVSRTANTVTFRDSRRNGETRRSKVRTDDRFCQGEYIRPDNYSMAPIFRAERKVA